MRKLLLTISMSAFLSVSAFLAQNVLAMDAAEDTTAERVTSVRIPVPLEEEIVTAVTAQLSAIGLNGGVVAQPYDFGVSLSEGSLPNGFSGGMSVRLENTDSLAEGHVDYFKEQFPASVRVSFPQCVPSIHVYERSTTPSHGVYLSVRYTGSFIFPAALPYSYTGVHEVTIGLARPGKQWRVVEEGVRLFFERIQEGSASAEKP